MDELSYKNKIRDLISKSETEKALLLLKEWFINYDEYHNEILLLLARFNKNKKEELSSLITKESADVKIVNINHAILAFLDGLGRMTIVFAICGRISNTLLEYGRIRANKKSLKEDYVLRTDMKYLSC